jgi:hypothetical protein
VLGSLRIRFDPDTHWAICGCRQDKILTSD